jgi:hypothetical protein
LATTGTRPSTKCMGYAARQDATTQDTVLYTNSASDLYLASTGSVASTSFIAFPSACIGRVIGIPPVNTEAVVCTRCVAGSHLPSSGAFSAASCIGRGTARFLVDTEEAGCISCVYMNHTSAKWRTPSRHPSARGTILGCFRIIPSTASFWTDENSFSPRRYRKNVLRTGKNMCVQKHYDTLRRQPHNHIECSSSD